MYKTLSWSRTPHRNQAAIWWRLLSLPRKREENLRGYPDRWKFPKSLRRLNRRRERPVLLSPDSDLERRLPTKAAHRCARPEATRHSDFALLRARQTAHSRNVASYLGNSPRWLLRRADIPLDKACERTQPLRQHGEGEDKLH